MREVDRWPRLIRWRPAWARMRQVKGEEGASSLVRRVLLVRGEGKRKVSEKYVVHGRRSGR